VKVEGWGDTAQAHDYINKAVAAFQAK
ncbi:inorganic pyrophosphatase, partial [Pseudomonas sp. ATCC 13867]